MLRRNQYEDEAEILAAPSDEILTATQNDDNVTFSQPSPIRCLAQRDKLSEVPCWGARHTFVFLAFLGFANVYAMRVNLSVAIVAMVNHTAIDHLHNSSNLSEYFLGPTPSIQAVSFRQHTIEGENATCPSNITPLPPDKNGTDPEPRFPDGPFVWDESMQSFILGSFFYGYVITQIPAGYLAGQKIVSSKWLLGIGILITSIFTVLMPWAAKTNYYFLLAIRVLEGMGEGVTFPVMHSMLAEWSPPLERSRMSTYVYSGATIGTVISMAVTGEICNQLGWESVFYIFGGIGILWFIFWSFLAFDSPASHPYITEAEKDLIEISLGKGWFVPNAMIESLSPSELSCVLQDISPAHKRPIADDCHSDTNKNCDTNTFECDSSQDETSVQVVTATSSSRHNQSKKQKKVLSVPWKDMFTSKPFWAIFLSTIPQTYGFYTLLTELPKYLSNILHYDLNEVSLVSALPAAVNYAFSVTASWIADTILINQWMSRTNTRKLMMFFGSVFPAAGLVMLAYLGCDPILFIAMLCLTTGFDGFRGSSSGVNIIDISPNYAGAVMGVVNSAGNVTGFVAPYVVGLLLSAGDDQKHWQIVFWLAGGGYFVGGILYMMLASGEVQAWNDPANNVIKTMNEIEQDANSQRNRGYQGPIMSTDFAMYDDDLIY